MQPQTTPLEHLIRRRKIVQEYPPALNNPLPFHNTQLPQHPRFYEEEIFEELDRTAIVERFLLDADYPPPCHEPMQA